MTKRLQVLLDDPEYEALQLAAAARNLSIAEWVRQALVAARRRESSGDVDRKLGEVERGYLSGVGPDASTGGY